MSSNQTVYFTNPSTITQIQGQVGSVAGQVSTNNVSINSLTGAMSNVATKFTDKYTFPRGMGPYQSDIIPVQVKSTVTSLQYGFINNWQGTGVLSDVQANYDLIVAVPSARTTEIPCYPFKTNVANICDTPGAFNTPYEDMFLAGSNMFFGGSTWLEGVSLALRTKYELFVNLCNSGTTTSVERNNALTAIQTDAEYITIRDNIKVSSQLFKGVVTSTGSYGSYVYDPLLAMDSSTPLSYTGATGTARPVYVSRTTYSPTGNALPAASNINASSGKMGLFLYIGHATQTFDVLMGNSWLAPAIASMGYVCVQTPSWGLNQSIQRFNSNKTLSKQCADKDITSLRSSTDTAITKTGMFDPFNPNYMFGYDVANSVYSTGASPYQTNMRSVENVPVNIPNVNLMFERYLYEVKCVLNQLGLANLIDFNNVIVCGASAGGSGISVIHKTLSNYPVGSASQLDDPTNPSQKAILFPGVKAIINNTALLQDCSYLLPNGVSVGNTFNTASDGFNMKEAFAHWLPLRAPLISVLGDGDSWYLDIYNRGGFLNLNLREFGFYNSIAQTVYQANTYLHNIDGNTTGAVNGSRSFAVYYPAVSHYAWQGPNAGPNDGLWGNSVLLGQGFNCDLAHGWYVPQQVQFPLRYDALEAGIIPEIESLQYDSLKRFVLFQMLVHRFIGPEYPVNIEAFATIDGYKFDFQPTSCEETQQTQWVKIGQQALMTYDNQNVVLKSVPVPAGFVSQAPSFIATGAGQSVAATSLVATTSASLPVYTIAGKPASSTIGSIIVVSDSPTVTGRLAYWSGSAWYYVSDNSAV